MGWLIVFGIVIFLLWGYPFIRCFFKRILLVVKIKYLCHREAYQLYKKPFWFLGNKWTKSCEIQIETPSEIYAIKLFGLPRRRRMLMLEPNGTFFIRRIVLMSAFTLSMVIYKIDGRSRRMPFYHFECPKEVAKSFKPLHKVLLVHPVTMTIHRRLSHGAELIVRDGDVVNGMEIYCLSGFLEALSPRKESKPL